MTRIILHLDMDAFFAAIEERERPSLKGKPIVVGSDPNSPAGEGRGRGVVATANYKAREYGIHSALPISTAWRLSEQAFKKGKPRAVFIGGHRNIYSQVSKEIMSYLKTKADVFEPASIDEAYIELKFPISNFQFPKNGYKKAEKLARQIKKDILRDQKLTCSIGIGPNKLIAKIASDFEKPDGLTIVRPEGAQSFLDSMPVGVIPGIGPKAEGILFKLGVKKIEDLKSLPKEKLQATFGKWGMEMFNRARGIDERAVEESREIKSIGEQHTFPEDTLDSNILMAEIKNLSESVFGTVKREYFRFRTVSIIVRFSDFETKTRAHSLEKAVQDRKILETEALQLFLPFLDKRENPKRKLIRLLGVRVEKLRPHSFELYKN